MVTAQTSNEVYHFDAFTVTHVCQPPGPIDCLIADQHQIIINLGEPVDMTWKTDVSVTVAPCTTHQILVLRPANSIVEVSCNDSFEYICISIDPSHAETMLGICNPFDLRTNLDDDFLTKLSLRLQEVTMSVGTSESLFSETIFVALLLHLNALYGAVGNHVKGRLSSSQLLLVSKYIHDSLEVNVTVEQLCSLIHLSRFHFTRLFKATTGLTPHRYILRSKIEYAKGIMKKRKGAILDAAYKLSFSDHAHFTNTFRKFTGVTPKSFLLNT